MRHHRREHQRQEFKTLPWPLRAGRLPPAASCACISLTSSINNAVALLKCQGRVSKSFVTRRKDLMRFPEQRFLFRRRGTKRCASQSGFPQAPRANVPRGANTSRCTRCRNREQPSIACSLHSRSFSGGAANSVYKRPGVAAVFLRHLFGPTTLPFDFRHRRAALQHQPLREQSLHRLVVIHKSQVAHHLAEKSRVQKVQNRMHDPADILIHWQPIPHQRRIERSLVIVARPRTGRSTMKNR